MRILIKFYIKINFEKLKIKKIKVIYLPFFLFFR